MKPKRAVSVQIAGQRLSLLGDADEASVVALAAEVEARIKDIHSQTRAVDSYAVALLAALQLAEELRDARAAATEERRAHAATRRALADLKRRVREKSKALLEVLAREAGV